MAQSKFTSLPLSFKIFLLGLATIFAVAIIILIIASSSAATATGSAPSLAISLASEMNTGILGPGDQRWFKFTPASSAQAGRIEQALTLFYTPNDGHQAGQVALQLFEEGQLSRDAGQMANFGAGQSVSRDNDPNSGELFWTGWLFNGQSYYIQVENSSQVAIDYWLFTDDVVSYPLEDEPQIVADTVAGKAASVPAPPADGVTPYMAMPLIFNPIETSQNRGVLAPRQEIWYAFSATDLDGEYFEEVALTMFATPNGGNQAERLTFDVFTAEEIRNWSPGNDTINNIGAGSLVQRDNDPLTIERFWTGWVVDGSLYYVRVRNGSDIQLEYWLFTGDVYNPELG